MRGRLRAVSLFLENRAEERKTSERASVTYERQCREPLVVSGRRTCLAALPLVRHAHRHARTATCFAFHTTDFQGKEILLAVYVRSSFISSVTTWTAGILLSRMHAHQLHKELLNGIELVNDVASKKLHMETTLTYLLTTHITKRKKKIIAVIYCSSNRDS